MDKNIDTIESLIRHMETLTRVTQFTLGPGAVDPDYLNRMLKLSKGDINAIRGLSGVKPYPELTWTEKQRGLALLLIHKYRRQLKEKFDIDVEPFIKDPKFENDLRILDTRKQIRYENEKFILKSPFLKEAISRFRRIYLKEESDIDLQWNKDTNEWEFEGSTAAVEVLLEVIKKYGPFEYSDEVKEIFEAYEKAVAEVRYPTVLFNGEFITSQNVSPVQSQVIRSIIEKDKPIAARMWDLADAEFVLDDSMKLLLPEYTPIQQKIIMNSKVAVNTNDIKFVDLVSFVDSLNLGSIVITFGWAQDQIESCMEELTNRFGKRIKTTLHDPELLPLAGRNRPIFGPSKVAMNGNIYIESQLFEQFKITRRLPVLIKLTGILHRSSLKTIEDTLFSKIILFQPTI